MTALPSTVEMIRALISSPSISSPLPALDQGNLAVLHALAAWLEDLGFSVDIIPLIGQPNKGNLVATLGEGPGGLVFAGHTDTVPYDDGLWNFDPFKGHIHDGKLYGLGTCDMKGFFALVTHAVATFDRSKLKHPLIILATADEETTMAGARQLAQSGHPKARYAVVGEPTSMRPIRMHKGAMMEAIRLSGRSGHSSNPAYGISALDGMTHVLSAILSWRASLQAPELRNSAFEVPYTTMNLGHIRGGDNPNRICGHCEVHLDARPLPGTTCTEIRTSLRERVEDVLQTHGPKGLRIEMESLFEGVEPFETPATSALVRAAERLTGHRAEAVGFGTEAPFFQSLGMETIVLGPGDIAQAHQPDEYIDLSNLDYAAATLQSLMMEFCCLP